MLIEDYPKIYKCFKKGNYQYRQIVNREAAKFSIEKGRIIVLPNHHRASGAAIYVGFLLGISFLLAILFAIVMLTLKPQPQMSNFMIHFSIILGIIVLIPIIIGLVLRISIEYFYILGPEGIAYKKSKYDSVKFIRWGDISKIEFSEKTYHLRIISNQVDIYLKNNERISFDTGLLSWKEFAPYRGAFPTLKKYPLLIPRWKVIELVTFVINGYYEHYKKK